MMESGIERRDPKVPAKREMSVAREHQIVSVPILLHV